MTDGPTPLPAFPDLGPDDLAYRVERRVLGHRVRFSTNAPEILEAIEASMGCWAGVAPAPDGPVFSVCLVARAGDEGPDDPPRVRYRLPDHGTLVFRTPGSSGVADVSRRSAWGAVTRTLVGSAETFGTEVVEALALMLVTAADRHPVHAATVAAGESALLLAGGSGAGKSTLAWAAIRAGMAVIGDDTAYVQLEPSVRVWTFPRAVRLDRAAARHFPGLAEVDAIPMPDGTSKVVASARIGVPPRPLAGDARVCVLSPGHDRVWSEPASPEVVARALMEAPEPGFDLHPDRRRRVAAALSRAGGWTLHLGPDPHEAIPEIAAMARATASS